MERQRRFVTNAGHEIKTPLAIIQANVEAMELYNGENKWSRNIREQTVRLAGLMQNLLALARMDEGAAQPHPTELRLDELVERALEGYAEAMEQRGLRLQAQLEPGLRVRADRTQLEQLVSLLLDNAVKHADQGGQILVELSKGEGGALLRLENSCAKLPTPSRKSCSSASTGGTTPETRRTGVTASGCRSPGPSRRPTAEGSMRNMDKIPESFSNFDCKARGIHNLFIGDSQVCCGSPLLSKFGLRLVGYAKARKHNQTPGKEEQKNGHGFSI